MCFNKENSICCCVLSILSALLVAAGVASVFFAGLISSILTLIIITLILGIIGILFIFVPLICPRNNYYNYIEKVCLVTSSVGAIVSSSFALAVSSLATGSLATSILIGVVAFFLIIQLINLINLVVAIISCNN